MRTATISQLKNQLSRYVDYVRRGGRVRVLDRQTPVAELIPAHLTNDDRMKRLRELEKQGRVRIGPNFGKPFPEEWYTRPRLLKDADVVGAVIEERDERR